MASADDDPTRHYHPWYFASPPTRGREPMMAWREPRGFPVRSAANAYGRKRARGRGFFVRQCADARCSLRTEAKEYLPDEVIPELRYAR